MNKVYLIAGGNLGNRFENIKSAKTFLTEEIGTITNASSLFETEPWGFEHENSFINQVFEIQTRLKPEKILEKIKNFEKQKGKKERTSIYLPREVDIDILFYNDEIINQPDLIIPHPRIQDRMFVLEPLKEIIPDFIHPVFNKSISVLKLNCKDEKWVKRLDVNIL